MAKMIDRTGRKYGKLPVLFRDTKTDKSKKKSRKRNIRKLY